MKNLTKVFLVLLLAVNLVCPPVYAQARTEEVSSLIRDLELGEPFNYENLTIVPIYSKHASTKNEYTTLDEAVKNGDILINEIEGGRVPQVKVTNKSGRYIFLMTGEILTGARQSRLVGKDVLLGPWNKEVVVPVYCVEHGRWDSGSYEFRTEEMAAAPVFRKNAVARKSQQEMWDGVAEFSRSLNVASSTQNLGAAYYDADVRGRTDKYVEALSDIPRLDEDAVGVAVAIGRTIVTVDIFGNAGMFADLWPKLLRSYAMGALAQYYYGPEEGRITREEVQRILNRVYGAAYERRNGIALGQELSATIPDAISSALAYRGAVVHLSIFPDQGANVKVFGRDRIPVIYGGD